MTLKELMDAADVDTLFRVLDPVCPERFVFWIPDYLTCFDKIKETLSPLLKRTVEEFKVGMSEDPLSPNERLPTVWADLEEEGA